MASSQITIFGDIVDAVDNVLDSYVTTTASNFIAEVTPIGWGMFLLLIVIWGYCHWFGVIQDSVKESSLLLFKSAVVLGAALSMGLYQPVILDTFMEAPEYFGSKVLYSGSSLTNIDDTANIVDEMMHQSGRVVKKVKDLAEDQGGSVMGFDYPDFLLILLAGFLWALSISLGSVATLFVLTAKVLLTVFLAIGPVFILCLLFKSTQRFFELWLGMLINMVLLVVLAIGLLSLMFGVIDYYVTEAAQVPEADFKVDDAVTVACVFVLSILLLSQVPQFASGLAGGVGVSLGNMVSKLAGGGALSALTKGARSFRPGNKTFDAKGNLISRGQAGLGYRGAQAGARGAAGAGQLAAKGARSAYRRFNPNSVKRG